jgi:purine-binding chemotaxis protein CheW
VKTFVRFRAGQARCLLPVEVVKEVCEAAALTRLPSAKPNVAGLIQRAGRSLTVIAPFGPGRHVLVITSGANTFGIVAEEVLGVIRVPEGAIGPAPEGQADPIVTGVLNRDDGQDLVVSAEQLWMRDAA